jgi:hypothetical protein
VQIVTLESLGAINKAAVTAAISAHVAEGQFFFIDAPNSNGGELGCV